MSFLEAHQCLNAAKICQKQLLKQTNKKEYLD